MAKDISDSKRKPKEIPLPRLGENMRWRTKNQPTAPTASPKPPKPGFQLFGPEQQKANAATTKAVGGMADSLGVALNLLTGKKNK